MPYFSFVSGQVRAQESRLLNQAQIDRMVGAETPEEAFRVLVESNYAEFIDEETTVKDFYTIIRQGLFETKDLLMKGSENDEGLRFLWLQFDINNIKRALKAKILEGKTGIETFSENEGYSNLAMLSQKELEEVVFGGHTHRRIPFTIYAVVEQAENIYKEADNFLAVEFALDKAMGEFFMDLRNERVKDHFLQKLVRHWIDRVNFRNLSRCVLIRGTEVPKETWITGGNVAYYAVERVHSADELSKYMLRTKFNKAAEQIDKDDPVGSIYAIERELDRYYYDFLKWESLGSGPGLAVLINYFERRMRNAQVLKLIMYGKFNGLTSEQIYDLLERL